MKREPSRETLSRPGKPRWPAARSGPRQPTVAAASAAIACLIFVTVRRQLDCAQPEKRADPAAGTPWPRPHPARSAVLPGLTWSNRGLAHRKADTTEQPDLKRPRTQPGAGRRRTDRRIFCAAATSADYVLLSLSVRPSTVTFINCRRALGDVAGLTDGVSAAARRRGPRSGAPAPVARGRLDKIPAASGFWDFLATAGLTAS